MGKKRVSLVIILVIIIGLILGVIIKNKYGNKYQNVGFNVDISKIESTDNDPVISYYDPEKGVRQAIEHNEVFNKKIMVEYNKGEARISKNGGQYEEYTKKELDDGKYIIVVLADNNTTVSIKEFEIDTMPPKIIGVQQARYNTPREIQLEDPNDVKVATLTKINGEKIDLKKFLIKKTKKYKVSDPGVYTIHAEDYNGNATTFKFTIIKE